MKTITFFFYTLALTIGVGTIALGQENPCPTISNPYFSTVATNNVSCTKKFTVHITNDVNFSNPKPVKVQIWAGSFLVAEQCFIASTVSGGADYVVGPFNVSCSTILRPEITRYTSSTGLCQGGICGAVLVLPVSFKSFSATRKNSNVELSWETGSEQNNTGFAVERNSNGNWQQIAFVASKALGGTSDVSLSYVYSDVNITKSVTQYRLRQVDFEGKSKFSEIRAVKGEGQKDGIIIYPNPSLKGEVNVVFGEGNYNVELFGLSGQMFNSWKANNSLQINNLNAGVYVLKTVNSTGQQEVKKIIVQ